MRLLAQPADQRSCDHFRAAAGRRLSESIVVVEVGIQGRAGRVQTAARCAKAVLWGCGPGMVVARAQRPRTAPLFDCLTLDSHTP